MKNLKYILLIGLLLVVANSFVLADETGEAIKFFKKYVSAANSYDEAILKMYSPDARIIRQVIKPDGTLEDIETDVDTYLSQLKLGQKVARLRRYKNYYTNINAEKVSNGIKISCLRQPTGENYRLRSYFIVKKQPNGKWLIVEEMMQTKVQTFLKYANR